jgi:peptidoglycan hydrolase-like protein with peptidoglycan-binding domain
MKIQDLASILIALFLVSCSSKKISLRSAPQKVEDVPAVVETVEEKIVDQPGTTFWRKDPKGDIFYLEETGTTYKTVKREIVKSPATTRTVEVPAEYKTNSRQEIVREETVEWTEILCGNNAKKSIIADMQSKLKKAGFKPGNTDGDLDEDTMDALNKYQKSKGLKVDSEGYINMDSLKSLGVKVQ